MFSAILVATTVAFLASTLRERGRFPRPAAKAEFPSQAPRIGPAAVGLMGEGPGSTQPSYAPNGSEVAFTTAWRGKSEIWAVSTVDGTIRPVFSDPNGTVGDPAWSPSGAWIAFASNNGGNRHIWLVHPDGTFLTQLTTGPANDDMPAWSPDSTKVAFASDRTSVRNVWLVNADGSGMRQITRLQGQDNHPSFSPDGTQIVFEGDDVNQALSNLWIINADGTGLRQLTSGAVHDHDPSWAARGIVFDSDRPGPGGSLWVVQANGTGLQVVIPNVLGIDPTWSLDGTKVAFSASAINEFNFTYNTTRQLVKVTGFSVDISANETSCGPGPIYDCNPDIFATIYSSSNFNPVSTINQTSITFGSTGDEDSIYRDPTTGSPLCSASYRPGITLPDLSCKFRAVVAGGSSVILRAISIDGIRYEGRGTVTPGRP